MMAIVSLCSFTHAEYQAVIGTANHNIKFVKWEDIDSIEGEWQNLADPYDCTNWSPSVDTQDEGVTFTQTANDCKQEQQRQVKRRAQEKYQVLSLLKTLSLKKSQYRTIKQPLCCWNKTTQRLPFRKSISQWPSSR